MEPTTTKTRDISSHHPFTTPDFTQGIYHSNTVNKDPLAVYEFAKVEANILQLFSDLPDGIENFFDLKLIDSSATSFTQYTVKYANNEKAKIKGELTLEMEPGPAGKGTVITAFAKFKNYSSKDEGPSDLVNVFLKRIKAMVETGVLATTKGQPSGEDEGQNRNLKH